MIKKALQEITILSHDDELNTENFMDALNYLDNVYKVVIALQKEISIMDIEFLPSFKGKYIAERLGIPSFAEENELRYFKIKSSLFLEDLKRLKRIEKHCHEICNKVDFDDNVLVLVLK